MTLHTIDLGDRTIAIRERGAGPPILLIHGNSCSSRAFTHQLESKLADDFRMIAIDLPGHGDSPAGADPDRVNTLPGYVDTLTAAVGRLGAETAVFVGWSLGGHILLEAADRLPDAAGFLIVGAPPVASLAEWSTAATDDPAVAPAFRAECTEDELHALLALFVRDGDRPPPMFVDDFRRTDPRARAALAVAAMRDGTRNEREIVARLARPLAIVRGAHDRIARNRDWLDTMTIPTLWRGSVQEIPDAGHSPQWETPAAFNAILEQFARDCLGYR